jgi:hypothetical protein
MSSLFSDDAPRLILGYIEHYNNIRLKSTVGYVSLMHMLAAASRRSTGHGRPTRLCTTSMKSPRAVTSQRGNSPNFSVRSFGRHSDHCVNWWLEGGARRVCVARAIGQYRTKPPEWWGKASLEAILKLPPSAFIINHMTLPFFNCLPSLAEASMSLSMKPAARYGVEVHQIEDRNAGCPNGCLCSGKQPACTSGHHMRD